MVCVSAGYRQAYHGAGAARRRAWPSARIYASTIPYSAPLRYFFLDFEPFAAAR
jgi:hypothetical protein